LVSTIGFAFSVGSEEGLAFVSRFDLKDLLSSTSINTSSFFGLGCDANSKSFAESLSVLAVSTGPKTRLFNLALFAFFVLARAPFAIVMRSLEYWESNVKFVNDQSFLQLQESKNISVQSVWQKTEAVRLFGRRREHL
jgi:hypothetical protein